ncbi:hypothetical protein D3C83_103800 [compost metagenome]
MSVSRSRSRILPTRESQNLLTEVDLTVEVELLPAALMPPPPFPAPPVTVPLTWVDRFASLLESRIMFR